MRCHAVNTVYVTLLPVGHRHKEGSGTAVTGAWPAGVMPPVYNRHCECGVHLAADERVNE